MKQLESSKTANLGATSKYSATIVLDLTAHVFSKNKECAGINYRKWPGILKFIPNPNPKSLTLSLGLGLRVRFRVKVSCFAVLQRFRCLAAVSLFSSTHWVRIRIISIENKEDFYA